MVIPRKISSLQTPAPMNIKLHSHVAELFEKIFFESMVLVLFAFQFLYKIY
eukprot:TRINITY_DN4545_c1_g1_i1.p2 TRINITY_DN4545_c1_g1~~TRINITY_DN4545_c1_g1_i1.p2  ORF type:complete len:51 (-),score=7.62 TRINITY_DN4545_c1_g1_i1:169-321(-)